ncbi:MAG: GreA/GreB family elongation factor [Chloroflexota bacterium]
MIDEHTSKTHVQIGCTVKLQGADGTETYTIVGSAGWRPPRGASPTSRRSAEPCWGRKKGDKVKVSVPAGDQVYEILTIS